MSNLVRFVRVDGNFRDTVYINPDRVAYIKEGNYPTIYLDAGYFMKVEGSIKEITDKLVGN
jgi:hypothetical protein